MRKLSDERLAVLIRRNDDQINPEVRDILIELQQLRSAQAADMERVRSVVRETFIAEFDQFSGLRPTDQRADRVATRAAEQLAAAGVGLSEEERSDLESLLEELADRREVSISRGRFVDAEVLRDQHAALSRLIGATK